MEDYGILNSEVHKNLILNMPAVCSRSGVPKHYLCTSMVGISSEKDITWVKNYPRASQTGKSGYVVQGDNVDTRCMYIAGALLRNYIDAVVVPLASLLEGEVVVDPTVLIVPNFYSNLGELKAPPAWKLQQIYDLLMSRLSSGKQTVLGVTGMQDMTNTYGNLLSSHIHATYFGVAG